jgi:hypothetical protein
MELGMYSWTRKLSSLPVLMLCCALSAAQDEPKPKQTPPRFGFDADGLTYPQKTPKEAMASIVKALDRKRVDYLLAQMSDPAYVDYWVDRYKKDFTTGNEDGRRLLAFDRLVRETTQYFENDPLIHQDLRVFAKKAEWKEEESPAVGAVESIPARKAFLKKIGDRWFLENRQQ